MVSSADVGLNVDGASRLLREARAQGARVAALPENFAFMGVAEADKCAIAENDGDGPIQSMLASLASELGLWIVAGTLPLRVPGEARLAAACLVYDAAGRRVARYDKIHLFDVEIPGKDERYQESSSVRPGATPVCVCSHSECGSSARGGATLDAGGRADDAVAGGSGCGVSTSPSRSSRRVRARCGWRR
jgi:nitrilase